MSHKGRPFRQWREIKPSYSAQLPERDDLADTTHLLAILRAHGGYGFPVLPIVYRSKP